MSEQSMPQWEQTIVAGKRAVAQGDDARAEALFREAVSHAERLSNGQQQLAHALECLARLKFRQQQHDEAEELFRRGLGVQERSLGPEHPSVASTLNGLAAVYTARGRHSEAEGVLRRALAAADRDEGANHRELTITLNALAKHHFRLAEFAEAEPLLLRLLALKQETGKDNPEVAAVLTSLAALRSALGRHDHAEQLLRKALSIRESLPVPNAAAIATLRGKLSEAVAAQARDQQARSERPGNVLEITYPADDIAPAPLVLTPGPSSGPRATHRSSYIEEPEHPVATFGINAPPPTPARPSAAHFAPAPTPPTQFAPAPSLPTPSAPTQFAPTQFAPAPSAPTPFATAPLAVSPPSAPVPFPAAAFAPPPAVGAAPPPTAPPAQAPRVPDGAALFAAAAALALDEIGTTREPSPVRAHTPAPLFDPNAPLWPTAPRKAPPRRAPVAAPTAAPHRADAPVAAAAPAAAPVTSMWPSPVELPAEAESEFAPAPGRRRRSMPRFALPRLSLPRVALPRVSVPRVSIPRVRLRAAHLRLAGAAAAVAALLLGGRSAYDYVATRAAAMAEPAPAVAEAPETPEQIVDSVDEAAAEPQFTGDAIGWVPAPAGEAAGRRAARQRAEAAAAARPVPGVEPTSIPLAPAGAAPGLGEPSAALPRLPTVKVDVRALDAKVRAEAKAATEPDPLRLSDFKAP